MADETGAGRGEGPTVDRDLQLGQALIERGVLTSETLVRCMRYQEEQRKRGRNVPLARILVTQGGVDKDVLLALRPGVRGALPCPLCRTNIKIDSLPGDKRFRCPGCRGVLSIEADRSGFVVHDRNEGIAVQCPGCQRPMSTAGMPVEELFPCQGCGSTVRLESDGQTMTLIEKVLPASSTVAPPAPTVPPEGQGTRRRTKGAPKRRRGRRTRSATLATRQSSVVDRESSVVNRDDPRGSTVSPPTRRPPGSRSTASGRIVDPEAFEARDGEHSERLVERGLLTRAQVQECLADGAADRARGSFLPIVHYAVKRGYLTPGHLKEVLEDFRTKSITEGSTGGGAGTQAPTLVEKLDRDTSPLGKRQGDFFAGHEILGELGRGGMGAVYRARDLVTGQIVALKVLLGGDDASRIHIKRFQREVEVVGKLEHRNIVGIHRTGVEEGYHYFTMDYCEGPTFKDALKNRTIGMKRALQIFIRILSGLDHAHRKGVVHRDLKPSNVILERGTEPIITDFGLAKQLDSESQLTKTESAVGTPHYMAPEQVSGGRMKITHSTDLYALGVMLYQVVAGRLPFRADNQAQLYNSILNDEPEPPSANNAAVDKALDTICLKAIAKDPLDRYPTARDFAGDIKRYLAGEPIQAKPPSVMSKTWRKVRRNPRTTLAVGVASLIAVSSLLLAVFLGTGGEPGAGTDPAVLARQKAETEYQRGLRLLDDDQAAQAVGAFEVAIGHDAGYLEPHLGLARAYERLGQFDRANEAVGRFLDAAPSDREGLLLWAGLALAEARSRADAGDAGGARSLYEESVRRFTRAIEAHGEDPEAYEGRSEAHEKLQMRREMISDRRRATELRQLATGNVLMKVRQLLLEGDLVGALAAVEPMVKDRPDDPSVQHVYGRILEAQNSLHRALAAYSVGVRSEPGEARHRIARARVLVRLGQEQRAAADLGAVRIDLAEGDESVYLMARVADAQGYLAESLLHYDAANRGAYLSEATDERTLADRRTDILYRRGRIRFRLSDHAGASKDLASVLAADENHLGARFLHGAALVEIGDPAAVDEARADLERALAAGYEEPLDVRIYLGRCALLSKQAERAVSIFEDALRADRDRAETYYYRAQAYLAAGEPERGLADARESLRLDPFRAEHHRVLGLAHLALEDYEAAEASFRKGLELDVNDFDNLIGIFRSLVGQGNFGKVMELEDFIQDMIDASWEERINLFEPRAEEIRSRYIEGAAATDRSGAPPVDADQLEGYFWALSQADETVREASIQELVEIGTGVLEEVRRRIPAARGGELAALREVEEGIAGLAQRTARRRVVATVAKAYLGKQPSLLDEGYERGEITVDALADVLGDPGEEIAARRLAARALLDIGSAEAVDRARRLVAATGSTARTRALTAAALTEAGFVVRAEALEDLLGDPAAIVRGLAVQSLPSIPAASRQLVSALADDDERVRLHAAARLAGERDLAALDVLLAGRDSGDPRARRLALRALIPFGENPRVRGSLIRSLNDDDPIVRRDAAIALGQLQAVQARPALIDRFTREHRRPVQAQILLALTDMADDSATRAIQPILFDRTQDTVVRGAAFFYFFRNQMLTSALTAGIQQLFSPEEDWVIRSVAMVVIGMESPGNQLVGLFLMNSVNDPDPRVRGSAAAGLTRFQGPNVIAALEKLLGDESEFVRGAAAGALVYQLVYGRYPDGDAFWDRVGADEALRKGTAAAFYRICVWPGFTPPGTEREQTLTRIRLLDRSMTLRPENMVYPRDRANLQLQLGLNAEAAATLDRAIATLPEDPDLHLWRGATRVRLRQWQPAAADFDRVLALRPRSAIAWRLLGQARVGAGDPVRAADAFGRYWLLSPDERDAQAEVARAFLDADRHLDLVDILDDAAYRWPDDAAIHWYRARALAGAGRLDLALEALADARRSGSTDLAGARQVPEFRGLLGRPEFERLLE